MVAVAFFAAPATVLSHTFTPATKLHPQLLEVAPFVGCVLMVLSGLLCTAGAAVNVHIMRSYAMANAITTAFAAYSLAAPKVGSHISREYLMIVCAYSGLTSAIALALAPAPKKGEKKAH